MPAITSIGVSVSTNRMTTENRLLIYDLVRDDLRRDGYTVTSTSKAFRKLDEFLNLGDSSKVNIDDLTPKESEIFLKMLSSLLKHGVVGYNVYEVNGRPEKHYLVNTIGDTRLYGKKILRKGG